MEFGCKLVKLRAILYKASYLVLCIGVKMGIREEIIISAGQYSKIPYRKYKTGLLALKCLTHKSG